MFMDVNFIILVVTRGGNMTTSNTKGFEIATDIRRHLLRVTLWGLWDTDLAKKYKYAMREKIEEIRKNGNGWYALVDFTRCYPRSEEVQDMLREPLVAAKEQGMKKIIYLGDKSVVQSRLDRVFPISNFQEDFFVESEEEAIQWLVEKSQHN
jgi:hypothetical protein